MKVVSVYGIYVGMPSENKPIKRLRSRSVEDIKMDNSARRWSGMK
jgi:hypothetical protein